MFASGNAQRFGALIEAAPEPIGVFRDGGIVYANPALVRLHGYDSIEELVGLSIPAILHPDDRVTFAERNARRARGEELEPYEYRLLTRRGTVLMVEMTSIKIELDDGPAVLVMMRDRTEQRRLEAELRQAERLAAVGSVAASVAHEINNPLAYVLANLEIALERRLPELRGPAARELESVLRAAREGAERVRAIAAELRELARADCPDGPIEVARAADAAIAICAPQLRGRVQVVRDHQDGVRVLGHEGRLVQVFVNLLVNGVQASARTLGVRTRRDDNFAEITIKDDGCGIPPDVLPRVFERFYSTKPREIGTGLGLPIAKDLVESMGGTIAISREPGATLARVRLPALESRKPIEPTANGRRARILLVDDEPAIGRALSLALGDLHDVVSVNGGGAAVELLARDDRFDVIFCDVTMPDLSGPEVFARAPAVADRFVFLTGGSPDRETQHALAATGRPVLQKPFELATIHTFIAGRRS